MLSASTDEGGHISDAVSLIFVSGSCRPLLISVFLALPIASVFVIQCRSPQFTSGKRDSTSHGILESQWQIRRSSETHTAYQQCSLVQKLAETMLLLFSLELGMRNAGCDGPNGTRFPLGLALVPIGPLSSNALQPMLSGLQRGSCAHVFEAAMAFMARSWWPRHRSVADLQKIPASKKNSLNESVEGQQRTLAPQQSAPIRSPSRRTRAALPTLRGD
jgi:hypothetical protein